MSKHKLEIEYDYDFHLLGISSHDKDYKFCWAVNEKLGKDFRKKDDIILKGKKKSDPDHFSIYEYQDEEMFTDFFIIVNRSGTTLLIPEHKQSDYFLMIIGNVTEDEKKEIMRKLKEITNVLTVFDIDPDGLKSKQNLIF